MRPAEALRSLRAMGPSSFPTGIRTARPSRRPGWLTPAMAVFFVVSNAFNVVLAWVVLSGGLDDEWYDFRNPAVAMGQLRQGLDDRFDPSVSYMVTALIGGGAILAFIGLVLLLLVWAERRVLARIQVRRGPNRVGIYGLLQPLADAIKLIQKETLIPRGADRFLF